MTTEVDVVPEADPPEKSSTPNLELSEHEIDEASKQLGYAVVKGRHLKDLKTIGRAVGGDHIHIGRAWLMMGVDTCHKMIKTLDDMYENSDTEEAAENAMKMKQKVVDSIVTSAKEMINSGGSEPSRPPSGGGAIPGFGPGTNAVPHFALQFNLNAEQKNPTKDDNVERSDVGPEPSRRSRTNPQKQKKKRAPGNNQRDTG